MFRAIDQIDDDSFSVVWDLGRRCTFACSYCGPHHSNKWSPHSTLDTLTKTLDGVVEYNRILNSFRKVPKKTNLSFTGGEPTANPDFFKFIEYAKRVYPEVTTNVTTNGCYTERKCKQIIDNLSSCTISYHAEASDEEKRLVNSGIKLMHESDYNFRVNLMFHKGFFDECVEVARWFDSIGIKYTPRVIGDSGNPDDVKDGTAHVYTPEQLQWFKDYWNREKELINKKSTSCEMATAIGRPCCAKKSMRLLVDDTWMQGSFVPDTNFKGWSCMINWYFLFINSEVDGVWHHQTCQINMDGQMGPIGKASEFEKINEDLKKQLSTNNIKFIRCPKTYCGCGLCASKAKDDNVAYEIFKSKVNGLEPIMQADTKDLDKTNSIIGLLKRSDRFKR